MGFFGPSEAEIGKARTDIETRRQNGQTISGAEWSDAHTEALHRLLKDERENRARGGNVWSEAEQEQRRRGGF